MLRPQPTSCLCRTQRIRCTRYRALPGITGPNILLFENIARLQFAHVRTPSRPCYRFGRSMRRKIRCRFELHSSEISGIPQEYGQIKLVIDHQQNNKRYAASYAIPTSGSDQGASSTKGLDDPAAWDPLLAFTCHVYPSKVSSLALRCCSSGSLPALLNSQGSQLHQIQDSSAELFCLSASDLCIVWQHLGMRVSALLAGSASRCRCAQRAQAAAPFARMLHGHP
jgi:hypothetical protein